LTIALRDASCQSTIKLSVLAAACAASSGQLGDRFVSETTSFEVRRSLAARDSVDVKDSLDCFGWSAFSALGKLHYRFSIQKTSAFPQGFAGIVPQRLGRRASTGWHAAWKFGLHSSSRLGSRTGRLSVEQAFETTDSASGPNEF